MAKNSKTTILVLILITIVFSISMIFLGFFLLESQKGIISDEQLNQIKQYEEENSIVVPLNGDYSKNRKFCFIFCPKLADTGKCYNDCTNQTDMPFINTNVFLFDSFVVKTNSTYSCYCVYN